MAKFRQFLTELSARDTPIFSFPDDNLSKQQWIYTKIAICIDIKEIWFGVANGQISSNFYGVICPRHAHISFPDDNLSKYQWIFIKLAICIGIKEISFGIAKWANFVKYLRSYLPETRPYFHFRMITLVNNKGFLTKLAICIHSKEIRFGIANGQIFSNFYGVICPRHVHIFISG